MPRAVKRERGEASPRGARAAGPALGWPGRSWAPNAGRSASPDVGGAEAGPAPSITWVEGEGDGAAHELLLGDARDVAGALEGRGLAGKVDLVYVDPPYASQADYVLEARLDGPADGRVRRSVAYADTWRGPDGIGAYLDLLAPRLEAATRLLAPTGTIWVHLDWRAAYLVRVVLDELLGRDRFLNEIVWRRAPNLGRQAASAQFGRTLDTIVVYGKSGAARLLPPTRLEPIEPSSIRWDDAGRPFTTAPRGDYTDASIARLEAEGRVHRTSTGRVYVKYFLVKDGEGTWCRERRVDALWTDVPPLRHAQASERTGFPTQKPRALLERVIACATPPGGLVVDLFSGSGTTGEAAHAIGRRAILGDVGPASIGVARARLLRAGAAVAVGTCGGRWPEAPAPVVRAARRDDGSIGVTLVEPREPLAWAISAAATSPIWHAERIHGARPVHPPPHAVVPAAALGPHGALTVRVYQDDGSQGTARIMAAAVAGAHAAPGAGATAVAEVPA